MGVRIGFSDFAASVGVCLFARCCSCWLGFFKLLIESLVAGLDWVYFSVG